MISTNLKNEYFLSGKAKLVFIFLLLVQFLPYFIDGQDAYIRVHDTLEGELNWYHVLSMNEIGLDFTKDAVVPQVMNGLTRYAFHSGTNITYFFIHNFGTFWGYVLNAMFLKIIAFIGMILLLKTYISKDERIIWGVALSFAWVPFYTIFGATVAMQPIVLFAFLQILNKRARWWHFIVLFILPFYSSIVWTAPAVIGGLFIVRWIHSFRFKKFNIVPLAILGIMSGLYLLANIQLWLLMFNPPMDFTSHRELYDLTSIKKPTSEHTILETVMAFCIGHYHVGSFLSVPSLFAFLIAGGYGLLRKTPQFVFMTIVLLSFFFGFYRWLIYLFAEQLPLLETFRFDRIIITFPLLWLVLLGFSANALLNHRIGRKMVPLLIATQLFAIMVGNDEFVQNFKRYIGTLTKPTYKQFYDETLFDKIEDYIDQPKSNFRAICLGLNPAILQHNGFYTLDGLQAVYSAGHKLAFQKIIEKEMAKYSELDLYFRGWGNRCYMFSAELGIEDDAFMINKWEDRHVKNLDINMSTLKGMGAKYIFSSVYIDNAKELDIELAQSFTTDQSYWEIHLYRINL